jgi:hypothetical protein
VVRLVDMVAAVVVEQVALELVLHYLLPLELNIPLLLVQEEQVNQVLLMAQAVAIPHLALLHLMAVAVVQVLEQTDRLVVLVVVERL